MSDKRYPIEPLFELLGQPVSMSLIRKHTPMGGPEYAKVRRQGLTRDQADRVAVNLCKRLPWEIWPEWIDDLIADESVACEECAGTFVPHVRSPHQRFCSDRCRSRASKRRLYRDDPEVRARQVARVVAYKEETRHAARLYAKRYRARRKTEAAA